jgi:hypothetical protein
MQGCWPVSAEPLHPSPQSNTEIAAFTKAAAAGVVCLHQTQQITLQDALAAAAAAAERRASSARRHSDTGTC